MTTFEQNIDESSGLKKIFNFVNCLLTGDEAR